jgi:hypothetical protein
VTERIAVPGGGVWVRPALESDDEYGLGWKLRYSPDKISRADQITLAEIVDAYGYLLVETTQEQRDRACREIRAALAAEGSES